MFNYEEFDIKLDTEYLGRNFIYVEETDSTNNYLLNNSNFENGTLLLAEYQTKGKGRREKFWLSDRDLNLTLSILLKDKRLLRKINLINLAAALSVGQSIDNLYQLNIELKWPNDVLINDKKVAGILMESTSQGSYIDKVIVGIGINVNQHNFTGKFDIKPTSIRIENKSIVSREKLLSEFLNTFEEALSNVIHSPEKVLNDWRNRCKMLGEKVKIESDEGIKVGIFDDVDQDGFLILKNGNEYEKIRSGNVSLRNV